MNQVRLAGVRIFGIGSLIWLAYGCAEPAQLGGLGVLNPNGLQGRMALAGRVNGAAVENNTTTEATKNRSNRSTPQPSVMQDAAR